LLRTPEKGLYRVHWSAEIIEEARRNLVDKGKMDEDGSHRLAQVMLRTFPEATVTGYEPLVEAVQNNEKDRHVVAAAIRCNAQVIVTTNLRDFPDTALEPYGLEAQHPDEFLCNLLDLDQGRVLQAVNEQAADLRRPPHTVLELLEALGKSVPNFAELVRNELPPSMTEPK
jgi:hypothetical protein